MNDAFLYLMQNLLYKSDKINTEFDFWETFYKNQNTTAENNIYIQPFFILANHRFHGGLFYKFDVLRKIYSNLFLNEKWKSDILDLFCKTQRLYHAFSRLAFLWKWKKAVIKIETDMFLEPISPHSKNVLTIMDNGYKYLFTLSDIILILKNSICNTEYFFSKPIPCKNPYNNTVFSKTTLYNIFLFIKSRNCLMPSFIQQYFLTEFDMNKFSEDNSTMIREHSIDNYINEISNDEVLDYTRLMIHEYNKNVIKFKINISSEFPTKKLIEVFKPYLNLFFLYKFSNNEERKSQKKIELFLKLDRFIKFNPCFGRKITRTVNTFFNKKHTEVIFDDGHICFHQIPKNFELSHRQSVSLLDDMPHYYHYRQTRRTHIVVNEEVNQEEYEEGEGEEEEYDNDSVPSLIEDNESVHNL